MKNQNISPLSTTQKPVFSDRNEESTINVESVVAIGSLAVVNIKNNKSTTKRKES